MFSDPNFPLFGFDVYVSDLNAFVDEAYRQYWSADGETLLASEAPQDETIRGGSGNDVLLGYSGDDYIDGGAESLSQNETDDTYRWLTQRIPRQHSLMQRAA